MMRTTLSKRIRWGVFLALTVLLLVLLEVMAGPRHRFHELVISQSEWTEIMAERAETDENLISDLTLDGQNLMYDGSENRWFYSLVKGSSTAYDPTVRVRGADGMKLVVLSDRLSEEMVENNEVRKLMAYTDDRYRVYDLVATTLPLVGVDYDGELGLADELKMEMELFDNRAKTTQRVVRSQGLIHKRGATTLRNEKPSYKLNLTVESLGGNKRNNFVSLLGMRQDDDWILYAPDDESRINNVLASNLWNEASAKNNSLGVDNGYEFKYVELLVNGKYAGLYALGYQPDEKTMALNTDREGNYDEFMFKKTAWGNERELDPNEDIEVEEDDSPVNVDLTYGFELMSETAHEPKAWKLLSDYYDTITTSHDENELKRIADLRTAIDYYLFVDMIQAVDQVSGDTREKNFILTFKRADDEYVALYMPWDLNMVFGKTFEGIELDVETDVRQAVSPVARILKLGDIVDLAGRYRELRMREWSDEAINEMLDEYEKQIFGSGAYARETERWPEMEKASEGEGLAKIREHILGRLDYLDGYHNLK